MDHQIFSVRAPAIRVAATATASVAVRLPQVGANIRIVNHGSDCYVCIGDNAATTIATVPAAGSAALTSPIKTCTPVLGGSDVVFGMNDDQVKWVSVICDAGATSNVDFQVGEGM